MFYFHYRRRSPKRSATQSSSQPEIDPDKLSQETFRLYRTVQNLLHTQEPILHAIDSTPKFDPTEVFDRKTSSRDSRLSIRSGTDDSMHSGSTGSKHETTDEDNTDRPSPVLPIPPPPAHNNHHLHHHPTTVTVVTAGAASSTSMADRIKEGHHHHLIDDESGFSSMNSFQEIGLPLVNSTMRSPGSSAASTSSESTEMENTTTIENGKERSTTLIVGGSTAGVQREKIGLPQISHRRWDSAPVQAARLQLSTESTSQVLWV